MVYLVGAFEASADHFRDAVHTVFRFLDDSIDFGKGGGLAYRRIFNSELELLDVGWYLINIV